MSIRQLTIGTNHLFNKFMRNSCGDQDAGGEDEEFVNEMNPKKHHHHCPRGEVTADELV